MKKAEVLKYCAEKAEEGYMTHLMILDIYNDEEEIPNETVDLICHLPEFPKPIIIHVGEQGLKDLNKACEEFIRYIGQIQIKDELMKKISKS
jgi:hypothetical protein